MPIFHVLIRSILVVSHFPKSPDMPHFARLLLRPALYPQGLPWQTKSILVMLILLPDWSAIGDLSPRMAPTPKRPKSQARQGAEDWLTLTAMPGYAVKCRFMPTSPGVRLNCQKVQKWRNGAFHGILEPSKVVKS